MFSVTGKRTPSTHETNADRFFLLLDDKRNSKEAVARLLLVVQEAFDITPSPSTQDRHRTYSPRLSDKNSNGLRASGSVDPYCEITVGALTLKTPFLKRTTRPKWNAPMQFLLYNLVEDVVHINIFDNEFFSPNGACPFAANAHHPTVLCIWFLENLGSASIHLTDILPCPLDKFITQPSLPFTQQLYLNNGTSVMIKFVVQLLSG